MSQPTKLSGTLTATVIIAATLAGAVFVNMLSSQVYGRIDLTENQNNSLSHASKAAVQALDDLEIRVYISPDLPEHIQDPQTGQTLVLRGIEQMLRDKMEEYRSHAGGSMTLTYVTDDVVEQAENAKLRLFAGDAATAKGGVIEFDRYVLGATFHYKNAMETLPLALYPEFYEFEITKLLLRLKEKVAHSLLMKDVLSVGERLQQAVAPCLDAIKTAKPTEDSPQNPFGLMTAEQGAARVQAYVSAMASIQNACDKVEPAMDAAQVEQGRHPPLDDVIGAAATFSEGYAAFQTAVNGDEQAQGAVVNIASQLEAVGEAVEQAHDNLVDSPGRKRIGFVCAGKAFCPFPSPEPLIPKELQGVIGQQNPFAAQLLPQLQQMADRINGTLANVERSLFSQRGFNLVRVDLKSLIPEDVTALVLFGPKANLGDAALRTLDQFVLDGGSLVVFLNPWDVSILNFSAQGEMDVIALQKNESDLSPLLAHWGFETRGDLVMEPESHDFLTVLQVIRQGQMAWQTQKRFDYPMLPVFTHFDDEDPLVRGVAAITLPFTTSLSLVDRPGIESKALIMSSELANTASDPTFPLDPGLQLAAVTEAKAAGVQTVAALATGNFTTFFPSDTETADSADETRKAPQESKGGRVLVIGSNLGLEDLSIESIFDGFAVTDLTEGSVEIIDKFRGYGANLQNWEVRLGQIQHTLTDNLQLLFNVLDWSTQQEGLVEIRSKRYQRRPLRPMEEQGRSTFQASAIAAGPLLVLLLGLFGLGARRRRRARLSL
jgi:ABC-type uncharacterized transport system involved in gliding motility auxiliary subunit